MVEMTTRNNKAGQTAYCDHASFASNPTQSRGRLVEEKACSMRSPFQRDRDRIVHSTAFRRLAHKTQVFVYHEGDHYRSRLTHSLEVAQIARSIARILGLNEDLTEAIALAHDFGHTPFGHAGERALNRVMQPFGGFDHNAQSMHIVTQLEQRYAEFDGLNLTWETLEGLVKHNGPLLSADKTLYQKLLPTLPEEIILYNEKNDLDLSGYASAEAQVAAIADDIAYNNHDLDDGLRGGLYDMSVLEEIPLTARILEEIRDFYPDLATDRLIYELNRRLITRMVEDVVLQTKEGVKAMTITSVDDVRTAKNTLVTFSDKFAADLKVLQSFLMAEVYHHKDISRIMADAESVVEDLAQYYLQYPEKLPPQWGPVEQNINQRQQARRVKDFVAGMTDLYALEKHSQIFEKTPDLR